MLAIIILIALAAGIAIHVHRREAARQRAQQREEAIQRHIARMPEEELDQVELQRMRYRMAPEWYLLEPEFQDALLHQFAPRWVAIHGRAVTEAHAARFVELLRAHPRTQQIENRLKVATKAPMGR